MGNEPIVCELRRLNRELADFKLSQNLDREIIVLRRLLAATDLEDEDRAAVLDQLGRKQEARNRLRGYLPRPRPIRYARGGRSA